MGPVAQGSSCKDRISISLDIVEVNTSLELRRGGGGALEYFLGGYVPSRTPNWHPVLTKNSPKIDTPF